MKHKTGLFWPSLPCLALCLSLSLIPFSCPLAEEAKNKVAASEKAGASAWQTKTQNFELIPEKGFFLTLGLQLRDTFEITYDPATKKLRSVKVSHSLEDPQGLSIFEYGSYQGKKKSAKKWSYTTTWYINVNQISDLSFNSLSATYPEIIPFKGQGRVLKLSFHYTLKGSGKIKLKKLDLTPMVSGELGDKAQELIDSYLEWLAKG